MKQISILRRIFVDIRRSTLSIAMLSLAAFSVMYFLSAFGRNDSMIDKETVALRANDATGSKVVTGAERSSNLISTSSVAASKAEHSMQDSNQMTPSPGASTSMNPASALNNAKAREIIEEASQRYQGAVAEVNQMASKFNVTLNSSDMRMPPPKTFTDLDHDSQFMRACGEAVAAKRNYEATITKFKSER